MPVLGKPNNHRKTYMPNETTPDSEINIHVQDQKKNPVTACFNAMEQLEKEGFTVNTNLEIFMANHRHGFLLATMTEDTALVSIHMKGNLSANSETLTGYKFKVNTTTRVVTVELRKT